MKLSRSATILGTGAALTLLAACSNGSAGNVSGTPLSTTLSCFPDLDGQIDNSEFPALAPSSGNYTVAPNAVAPGSAPWHLDFGTSGDHTIDVVGEALGGQWYAPSFPCVSVDGGPWPPCPDTAFIDDPDNDVVEILARDDSAVWLYGLTSQKTLAQGGTLLVYAQPIPFLEFPLAPGLAWTAMATFKGTYAGIPVQDGTQTYETRVDSVGALFLPDVRFTQALSVTMTISTNFGALGASAVVHQVQWFSQCAGEVARFVSQPSQTGTTENTLRRVVFP